MTFDTVRDFCLSLQGVYEDMPFGESALVFKVGKKMFLLMNITGDPITINVKCDPEKAIELREHHPMNVKPGYHMSKKHWNTVVLERPLDWDHVKQWITDSYDLVFAKLPKKEQLAILNESEA